MLELKISFGTFFGLRTRRILIDFTKVNDPSKYKVDLSFFSDYMLIMLVYKEVLRYLQFHEQH